MDLSDLGFADINAEPVNVENQKYWDEYYIITKRSRSGEITREEWLDLWLELRNKFNIPIDPNHLTPTWINKHLNQKSTEEESLTQE